jgi:hypothetical protein
VAYRIVVLPSAETDKDSTPKSAGEFSVAWYGLAKTLRRSFTISWPICRMSFWAYAAYGSAIIECCTGHTVNEKF